MRKNQNWKRRQFLHLSSIALGTSLLTACTKTASKPSSSPSGKTLEKVKLGFGWKAQAEYGGFYQAVATGIYRDYGLEVTIESTPPQTNVSQLLLGGLIDFSLGHGVDMLKAIAQGIPKVTIASIFQQEIQILLAHPGVGNDSLAQLKGKPIFISPAANLTYWPFLKKKYGFTDDQPRPYNFNVAPFLAEKNSAQQGILTSEPYTIEQKGGFKPVVLPLTEAGYNPYTFTIETTKKLVETNPDRVQRFVEASIKGWYSYLNDPQPGNALIKTENPEMTDDLIAYGIGKLKEYGIVTSGDAATLGIGAMSEERWKTLFDELVAVGILDSKVNYKDAYTLEFINQGIDRYKNS
jgi:NitT/TauT family transport system substrate-binding protein